MPEQPSYQGRPLARPQDELVDQGLGFDLGTVLSRRRALGLFGLGAAGLALTACGVESAPAATSAPTGLAKIPSETAGPYPGNGSNGPDVLEQSGIIRSDLRTSFGGASGTATGIPMTLELTLLNLNSQPLTGVAVYVWQCDAQGRYSLYSPGVEQENYLRGVQIADAAGGVRFRSVFPACYPGRWPHIHFEVYPDQGSITNAANVITTSQVALPAEVAERVYAQPGYEQSIPAFRRVSLSSDSVFREDGGATQLATVTGDVTSGYTVSLRIGVDRG